MYVIYFKTEANTKIAVGAGEPKTAKIQSPPWFVTQEGYTKNPEAAEIFKTRDDAEEAQPKRHPVTEEQVSANNNPFQIITSQVLASYISNGLQLPATEIINE